jgi:hypothetical protein
MANEYQTIDYKLARVLKKQGIEPIRKVHGIYIFEDSVKLKKMVTKYYDDKGGNK